MRPSSTVHPSNAQVFRNNATICFAFQTSANVAQTILSQWYYVSGFNVYIDGFGFLNAEFTSSTGPAVSSAVVNNGAVHYCVVTWNGTTGVVTMYLDGVAQTSTQTGVTGPLVIGASDDFAIGCQSENTIGANASTFFNGKLGAVGVADVAASASQISALNTILATWAASGPNAYTRSVAEAVSAVTDGVLRVGASFRSVADFVLAMTDGITRVDSPKRAPAESIVIPADSPIRLITETRGVSESVSIPVDASARLQMYSRSLAETILVPSDGASRSQGYVRGPTESVTAPSDAVSRLLAYLRNPAEGVGILSDSPSRIASVFRSLAESMGAPSDAVLRGGGRARSVAEAVSAIADAVSRLVTYLRVPTESIGTPSDALVHALT